MWYASGAALVRDMLRLSGHRPLGHVLGDQRGAAWGSLAGSMCLPLGMVLYPFSGWTVMVMRLPWMSTHDGTTLNITMDLYVLTFVDIIGVFIGNGISGLHSATLWQQDIRL